MKVTVIYGQKHKGSTYNATRLLVDKLDCNAEDISEFYVNGMGQCVGCFSCILKDENLCPHREQTEPIIKAIEQADVIVLSSPNYCFGMTGQLKSFCDHMAYRWMIHRPVDMRGKLGVAVSTTAGGGAGAAAKQMRQQMSWWSVGRTFSFAFAVWAEGWDKIDAKRMTSIKKKADRLAKKLNRLYGKSKPSLKTSVLWGVMRKMHIGASWNELERIYWTEQLAKK